VEQLLLSLIKQEVILYAVVDLVCYAIYEQFLSVDYQFDKKQYDFRLPNYA